eukprot:m.91175 g.91175  ORF g.91175 m.91175 type:complete len:503 (-) comp14620_c0_seq1:1014-2522(-)
MSRSSGSSPEDDDEVELPTTSMSPAVLLDLLQRLGTTLSTITGGSDNSSAHGSRRRRDVEVADGRADVGHEDIDGEADDQHPQRYRDDFRADYRAGQLMKVNVGDEDAFLPRVGHTLVAVNNTIYCVSGFLRSRALSRQLLASFSWERCTWEDFVLEVPPNDLNRTGASTVSYLDRYLIVFGGFVPLWGQSHTNDVVIVDLVRKRLLYNSERGARRGLEIPGCRPHRRDKHTAVVFGDRMYVFGGWGSDIPEEQGYVRAGGEEAFNNCGWTNTLYSLDLEPLLTWDQESTLTLTWRKETATGDWPAPRAAHSMVLHNHSLIVFGGRTRPCRTNEFHELDLLNMHWRKAWRATGAYISPRSWQSAVLVEPHHMYIQGGLDENRTVLRDAYLVDLESHEAQRLPDQGLNVWHSSVYVAPFVYSFGGSQEPSPNTQMHDTLFCCRPRGASLFDRCVDVLAALSQKKFEVLKDDIPEYFQDVISARRATYLPPSCLTPAEPEAEGS